NGGNEAVAARRLGQWLDLYSGGDTGLGGAGQPVEVRLPGRGQWRRRLRTALSGSGVAGGDAGTGGRTGAGLARPRRPRAQHGDGDAGGGGRPWLAAGRLARRHRRAAGALLSRRGLRLAVDLPEM